MTLHGIISQMYSMFYDIQYACVIYLRSMSSQKSQSLPALFIAESPWIGQSIRRPAVARDPPRASLTDSTVP